MHPTTDQANVTFLVANDDQSFAPGDTVSLKRTPSTPPAYNIEHDSPGTHTVVRCDHVTIDREDELQLTLRPHPPAWPALRNSWQ